MELRNLLRLFSDKGCNKIYLKNLSPNDNSKNQVYLGGSFEILNALPIREIKTESAGDWKRERFKALLSFSWLGEDGELYPAPNSQLILYPKYPEVRFSGFLTGCENPPSHLMTQRLADRLLIFGVSNTGVVIGYVAAPTSQIATEFESHEDIIRYGVFKIIELPRLANNRERLLQELKRIHLQNWIISKRLDHNRNVLPCLSPNCGGYTLEAELGVTPNGFSEPDFLDWEVKQFRVENWEKHSSVAVTLMTPEPTNGLYVVNGVEDFIRKYGYNDISGIPDRLNFGGVHKSGLIQPRTNLKLVLIGFDEETGKIRSTEGKIALLDGNDNEAASWSFSSMMLHWIRKHNQACYVPCQSENVPVRKYRYGNKIILGVGTDFQLFLTGMASGKIYYDPGIKMENSSSNPKIKRRSQFRMKSIDLPTLYHNNEVVNLLER